MECGKQVRHMRLKRSKRENRKGWRGHLEEVEAKICLEGGLRFWGEVTILKCFLRCHPPLLALWEALNAPAPPESVILVHPAAGDSWCRAYEATWDWGTILVSTGADLLLKEWCIDVTAVTVAGRRHACMVLPPKNTKYLVFLLSRKAASPSPAPLLFLCVPSELLRYPPACNSSLLLLQMELPLNCLPKLIVCESCWVQPVRCACRMSE